MLHWCQTLVTLLSKLMWKDGIFIYYAPSLIEKGFQKMKLHISVERCFLSKCGHIFFRVIGLKRVIDCVQQMHLAQLMILHENTRPK